MGPRAGADREHAFDIAIEQSFAQQACPTLPVAPNRMTFIP
jgi:hypothetical protein